MKYFGHRKLSCELSKLSKFNAFNLLGYLKNTDASILVYKFRPKRTGYTINFPCLTFLLDTEFTLYTLYFFKQSTYLLTFTANDN